MMLERPSQGLDCLANYSRTAYHALGMSNAMISAMAGNDIYRKRIKDLQRCAAGDAKGRKVIWGVAAVMNSGQKEKQKSEESEEREAVLSMLASWT